jgi:hypothetical protein
MMGKISQGIGYEKPCLMYCVSRVLRYQTSRKVDP